MADDSMSKRLSMQAVLASQNRDPVATVEFVPEHRGIFCGLAEVLRAVGKGAQQVWSLDEGEELEPGRVALRLRGKFFAHGEAAASLAAVLALNSGWASAAQK